MRPSFKKYRSPYKSVLIIKSGTVSDFRVELAGRHLALAGYDVEVTNQLTPYKLSQHDVIICSRPMLAACKFLENAVAAGLRVIVDLDDDMYSIPNHNPAYEICGLGNPEYHTALVNLLPKVEVVFASPELVNRYGVSAAAIVPNYYDDENSFWKLDKLPHPKVNLGFTGTITHREDFRMIVGAVKRVLQNPNVRLVVALDHVVYAEFNYLPEEQKLFLPPFKYEEYPLSFRYFDILLVPLVDNNFNRAKSDIKLIECGVSRTPWIASNLPQYTDWEAGGLLVGEDEEQWYVAMEHLVHDAVTRERLAAAGYVKSKGRASSVICQQWVELVEHND